MNGTAIQNLRLEDPTIKQLVASGDQDLAQRVVELENHVRILVNSSLNIYNLEQLTPAELEEFQGWISDKLGGGYSDSAKRRELVMDYVLSFEPWEIENLAEREINIIENARRNYGDQLKQDSSKIREDTFNTLARIVLKAKAGTKSEQYNMIFRNGLQSYPTDYYLNFGAVLVIEHFLSTNIAAEREPRANENAYDLITNELTRHDELLERLPAEIQHLLDVSDEIRILTDMKIYYENKQKLSPKQRTFAVDLILRYKTKITSLLPAIAEIHLRQDELRDQYAKELFMESVASYLVSHKSQLLDLEDLTDQIQAQLDANRGANVAGFRDPQEATKTFSAAELLYFSLINDLPLEFNESSQLLGVSIKTDKKGLIFTVNDKKAAAYFKNEFNDLIRRQVKLNEMTEYLVLGQSASLIQKLYNQYVIPNDEIGYPLRLEPIVTWVDIQDTFGTYEEFKHLIAPLLSEPSLLDSVTFNHAFLFSDEGIVVLERESPNFQVLTYNSAALEDTRTHLNDWRKYNKSSSRTLKNDRSNFYSRFFEAINNAIANAQAEIPETLLSSTEKTARKIQTVYGVKIHLPKIGQNSKFDPIFSENDLSVIEETLRVLGPINGYITIIEKHTSPDEYAGSPTLETALMLVKNRYARSPSQGLAGIGLKGPKIITDEAELLSLYHESKTYFPLFINLLCRGFFDNLDDDKKEQYAEIVKDQIAKTSGALANQLRITYAGIDINLAAIKFGNSLSTYLLADAGFEAFSKRNIPPAEAQFIYDLLPKSLPNNQLSNV